MMGKYSKFGVEIFNTFWVMGYIKFLHDADNKNENDGNKNLAITIAGLFLWNGQAKKYLQ